MSAIDEALRTSRAAKQRAEVPPPMEAKSNSDRSVPESPVPESEWPELIDLEEPPIDRLPSVLLPGWYGDMIRAVSVSTETPIEMAALVALGAIATATMRKFDVLIEQGFCQSLNLYCVVVMEPGNRKSAVHRSEIKGSGLFYEIDLTPFCCSIGRRPSRTRRATHDWRDR